MSRAGASARPPSGSPHVEAAERYVEDVLSGKIPSCRRVRLACERHRRDLIRQDWRYEFSPEAAERACRFIEKLPHSKGRWAHAKELLKLEPWQCFKTVSIFGWLRKGTRLRRFNRALLLEPRKNGKSAWAAAVGLYMLCADGEHGAEVLAGATSRDQAKHVFGAAREMARRRPDLRRQFGIVVNISNMSIARTASMFEPVIGKPGDGASPSLAVSDEFHEHKSADQYETFLTGMGARDQPLWLGITTAGDDVSGPCYDALIQLRKVLDGVIVDDELWGIEYTIDEDVDDWTNPAALEKANPNIGVSVSRDYLVGRQAAAIRNPRDQASFKTKHLNLWVSSRSAYFDIVRWAACYGAPALDEMPLGADVIIAIDLASKKDIAAVELLFPQSDGTMIRHGLHYVPAKVAEDPAKKEYGAWAIAGTILVTDGDTTDQPLIRDQILYLAKRFNVLALLFDPHQAHMLVTELQEENLPCIEFGMNVLNMSEPMKQLDADIIDGKLRHNCGPLHPMTWQVSNVVARADGKDNVYPRKEREELKIDGPVALIMARAQLTVLEAAGLVGGPEIRVW